MFNNINDNNSELLYASLNNAKNIINLNQIRSNLQKSSNIVNPYIDKSEISANAMQLFQRDLDINKFTKIAVSDKDDNSYLQRMQELFKDGIIDAFEDDVLSELVTNSKLWNDLEL